MDPKENLRKRIENDFVNHAPDCKPVEEYTEIRVAIKELALKIVELTPVNDEQSAALSALEGVFEFAGGSIARNEK